MITDDHRVRAPAPTLRAVACTEPPTTPPLKNPAKTLATPCPTKSRLVSPNEPSALVIVRLIPAPWTRPMITSESAGTSSAGTSDRSGSWGNGSARGMGAMSPTTAIESTGSSATTTVMTRSGSAMAKSLSRVCLRATTRATVTSPIMVVSTSDAPGCMNRSAALSTLLS